jgi:archaetidylinositol phosphate synthase
MTLYKYRERFQDLSIRVGILFSKIGISPNQWTMLSLVPALLSLYFLINSQFIPAAFLFLLSSFLDIVDGSVARVTGRVSDLGAYMDTIVDRYVEFMVLLGILLAGIPGFLLPSQVWIFIYLFGSLMTTYSKAAAQEKGISRTEVRGGILERAERLIILTAGIFLASLQPVYLTYVIALLAVLSNLSALQRILKASLMTKE